MTLADRNHLMYASGRAIFCGVMPSIVETTLESYGFSPMVSKSAFVVNTFAMQYFVCTRSSDRTENKIAAYSTFYSSIGAILGEWTFSSYLSKSCSSLAANISAACLGSLGSLPFISARFLQEHDRRLISHVRGVQQ